MVDSSYRLNSSLSDANFKLTCDTVFTKFVSPEKTLIDSILAYNDNQQPDIVLPDGRTFFWYFAFGSMMNPISLYLRQLIPLKSYPATCVDHKIVFRHPSGMADIEACQDSQFEGVIHLLTDEQMKRLDGLEIDYHRIKVTCIDYENQYHVVYAYQTKMSNQPVGIPHERYLDIITKGCEYYQVRPEYINQLKNDQSVIPRKQPSTFQTFTNIPADVYYTKEELEKHNGEDPSLPLWVCVNGAILEYIGMPAADHPDYESHQYIPTLRKRCGGREIIPIIARGLYEPIYRLPLNDDDICDEQRAQIEDFYLNTYASGHNKAHWKPIGRLRIRD